MNEKIIITTVICITIIECMALLNGINGVLLTTVIGALCVLAGKVMPQWKAK